MADLSKGKGQEPVPQWAFIGFICIGIQGVYKAHQTLSGSNDQTIDTIQRTMSAYFESGSDSYRAIKLWGNKFISCLDPCHSN